MKNILPPPNKSFRGNVRDTKSYAKKFWKRIKEEKKNDPKGFEKRNLERKLAKDPGYLFKRVLKAYSLKDFINEWLYIFNPSSHEFEKWICWEEQAKLCDELERSKDIGKSLFILLKARRVGGSQIVAAYIVWKLLQGDRYTALVISQTEREAKYFIKTIIGPILEHLPKVEGITWPKFNIKSEIIEMEDGSSVEALPSSPDAGRGRTYNLVVMDEAAAGNFMFHADENYQSVKHTVESAKGMMIVISTAKNGTWFNQIAKDTINGDVKNAGWFFIGWKGVPSRNKKWYEQEQSAASSDFSHRQEMPERWEDCFISRSGLVFPDFNPTSGEDSHVKPFVPEWNQKLIVGFDDGFNDDSPAVFLITLYDKFADHLYVLDEIFWRKTDRSIIGKQMRQRLNEWQMDAEDRQGISRFRISKAVADTVINRENRGIWEILKKHANIDFGGAKKQDLLGSLALLSTRVKQGKITIHPRCKETIRQVAGLVWKTIRSGRGTITAKDQPVDIDDDAVDVIRYIERELQAVKQSRENVGEFVPYSRKASDFKKKMKARVLGLSSVSNPVNPWVDW